MLSVDKKQALLLHQSIQYWRSAQLISEEQAQTLQASYTVRNTDWQAIGGYIFVAAISCALMAFGSLVLNEKWIEILRKKFSLNNGMVALLFALLSAFLCYHGQQRRRRYDAFSFDQELYWILPILSIGVTVVYTGKGLDYLDGNYGVFWLLAGLLYGAISVVLHTTLLGIAALLCVVPGYVNLTYFLTQPSPYWLGMNLPVRMLPLGGLLLLISGALRNTQVPAQTKQLLWYGGWLLLLVAGWLISIFGNSATWENWQAVRQMQFIWWVIIYTLLCSGAIALGIRFKDTPLRDMGVVFLLVDGYTRYFEYLWDRTHKGIFFGIMAISLWLLGRQLERYKRKEKATRLPLP
ncbi:hypothetical protein GA0116948_12026 [Chitinophaga costaii]|uniref:DUF2157 domain-containing protein n=1 Tax=Chitinophaga costaii TaxID=1335309 RepID=A0A1C4G2G3_9BACT|nr:hypothetical protein [Chitinophaga costaii]PUZ19787.1 hypothetical protein DCM91_20145 [Chitinophaga costaii]SCC62409.1 hypothetical protein GA0116948_12026 [Chitinophaga costaii]